MSGFGQRPHALRRWVGVVAVVGGLISLPTVVSALPVHDVADLTAAALLRRIQASDGVGFSGYAESTARLQLPSVPRVGDVLELLGETTEMRVWYRGPRAWRVDALSPVGERDTYQLDGFTWIWDSFKREATQVVGEPTVRLARPADLAPHELGRRLAHAATAAEASRIEPRRVAGRTGVGLRLVPRTSETTIGRVDIWADARTGLPLRVAVTTRVAEQPIVDTVFLDLTMRAPSTKVLDFVPPPDADLDQTIAADVAAAVDRFSPFVLPESLDGRRRRSAVGSGAGTFGEGFAVVAVLTLRRRDARRAINSLDGPLTPRITLSNGMTATVIETPLLNGLIAMHPNQDPDPEAGYALSGTVPRQVLERIAVDLLDRPLVAR